MTRAILLLVFLLSASFQLIGQTSQACLECHNDNSLTMTKHNKEVSLYVNEKVLSHSTHAKVSCVGCHTGFDPDNVPHKEPMTAVNCLSCHNKALTKHAFHINMVKASGRGGTPDVDCKGCHGTHEVQSPKIEGTKFSKGNIIHACGKCHEDVTKKFLHSEHHKAAERGIKEAPLCLNCHQSNITRVTAALDSVQLKLTQEKICISCHLENPDVADKTVRGTKFIESYDKSIHGSALREGNAKAASCVNCHGSHEMNKSISESSRVNRMHIQQVCSQCHAGIEKEFSSSVHAKAVMKGNKDAPVCTDCHGEHNILKHTDPDSPVSAKNVSQKVCGTCHASVKMSQKYGLSTDRFRSFSDSYHGLAVRGGSVEVVNCASCHGAHSIKHSSDSTSTVNKENLIKTCGKCHPGANTRFAIGSVHSITDSEEDDPILYWIANMYLWLIIVIIGGMFFHNVIDFIKKVRRKLLIQQGVLKPEEIGHRLYLRMTLSERLQHGTLVISFVLLVITGFMLRYPDAWWVASIRNLSDNVFEFRSWIHRIAGVTMVLASIYHIYYIFFNPRGRQLIRDLLPKMKDFTDAMGVLRYNLGLHNDKPQFGRFSYIEKSEYWALVWGTFLMGLTGVILWFENTSMGMLSKLGWDISRTIHFYEAILATLAIIVWHFYFVIFNPDVYPMSLAWLTGKVSEEEMHEEHPLELHEIKKREFEESEKQKGSKTP
ncbi:cytochrome b/b6 domain-containing protein [bacterium]|nr:cytochrome b/b6 domain-containing protein [bacterium]